MLDAMSALSLVTTAVVTVTYNSSAHLLPFLESVKASETDRVKIVIADNNSADVDATTEIASSMGATVLRLNDNRGYGGAINEAIAALPPDIDSVLISNPDVILHPGTLSALVKKLSASPEAAAVGPKVLNSDGSIYPSARKLPSLRTGIGHALFAGMWPTNPWTRSYREDQEGSERERAVGWLSGSCLLVRRDVFTAVGGFDEGFFMYFEDVDLGYRFGKHGWKNLYFPIASVVHTGAHSTTTESTRMIQAHHDSAYRYLGKKYAATYLAPLRWALRAGLTFRAQYLIRKSQNQG